LHYLCIKYITPARRKKKEEKMKEEKMKEVRRYKFLSLCVLFLMTASTVCAQAGAQDEPARLSSRRIQYAVGLARLWSGIKQNFVFMDKVKLNWDSVYAVTLPLIERAQSDGEATLILQRMAALVHDGHTFVWGKDNCYQAPFTLKCLDGKVYVDAIWSSELKSQGLRRGMELLAVNDLPVKAYAEQQVVPNLSSSTPQWTEHLLYQQGELTSSPEGTVTKYTFSSGLVVNYESRKPQMDLRPKQETYEWKVLKGGMGYLRISTFNDGKMQSLFAKLYPDIQTTKSLIIDIRHNGGGNSGNGDFILRHLFSDSIRTDVWRTRQYNAAFASWGIQQDMYVSPPEGLAPIDGVAPYLKPVVLLVDNGTFSAAENFTSVFKAMKRGVIIGVPTGGSTGNGVRIELIPGVCTANICSKWDTCPDGTEFVGIGFKPDLPVVETYRSYFVKNEDVYLKAAVGYLSKCRESR
jgi:carboxyl-terminal processing protease